MKKQKIRKKEEKSAYTSSVPAVNEALQILVYMSRDSVNKMNLTEICNSLGIHKSKAYSILNTLQHYDFIQKDEIGKTYSLGPGLISLSRKVLDNFNYREIVRPSLEALADETQCSAIFGVIVGNSLLIVAKRDTGAKFGVTIGVGNNFPLTWGAHGKAIVAFMEESERQKILESDELFFHGDPSALNRETLSSEFNKCRQTGYAIDLGKMNQGINAAAAPVFRQDKVIGAIFVVGTFPKDKASSFGTLVAGKAHEISVLFGEKDNILND